MLCYDEVCMPNFPLNVALAGLRRIGVEVSLDEEWRGTPGVDRAPHTVDVIGGIRLPLTADEWCSLCQREGADYIGSCCGSASRIQDTLNNWFRDGGYIHPSELAFVAELHILHDSKSQFATLPSDLVSHIEYGQLDVGRTERNPWDVLAAVHHLCSGHFLPKKNEPAAAGDHLSPLEKSISVVANLCNAFSWDRILREDEAQLKARRAIALHRFLPALKTLTEAAHQLYLGPFDGFAVIDKEAGPNAIAQTRMGYALYESVAEIEGLFAEWDSLSSNYEDKKHTVSSVKFGIRPVRVTLEDGIVFTDTNERYVGVNT